MGHVRRLSPLEFEYFGKFLLESLGYQHVQVTEKKGKKGWDRGIDIIATWGGEKVYGECKRWSVRDSTKDILPIRVVRALGGCLLRDGVGRGIVITTLRSDALCKDEGQKMGIGIFGSDEIIAAMRTINPSFGDDAPGLVVRILRAILRVFWFFATGRED